MKAKGFKDIEFGMAAAENECAYKPDLLIDGFLDAYGYINDLINGYKFLVLGPKGSGKSAIGYKIELLSDNKELFVQTCSLEDFPYNSFSGLIPGGEAPEIKYPSHWELLLLIALSQSFLRDKECISTGNVDIKRLATQFRDLGIISGKSILSDIVKTTTKNEFKIELPKILTYAHSSEKQMDNTNIKQLLSSLQEAVFSIKNSAKHFIIIDGLDRVLTKREGQYKSLTALIYEADQINNKFRKNGVKAKVILLCRSDLFEKLSGPDLNKIKRDMGLTLNWYQTTKDIKKTNLVKLLNLRAKNSLDLPEIDIFEAFMPEYVTTGKPTTKHIFDFTRRTPRDIIQLLNEIQKQTKGTTPKIEDIEDGLDSYSKEHFTKEIRDELAGYLEYWEIELSFKLLGKLSSYRFTYQMLDKKKNGDDEFKDLDLKKILRLLYECGAIGFVRMKSSQSKIIWKFLANEYVTFNPDKDDDMVIHRGLRGALDLRWQ